jgi:hypothetical protein
VVVVLAMALALVMPLRVARGLAVQRDYRPEVGYWQYLGNLLEHRSTVIMLSHNYGARLQYYGWVSGTMWLGGSMENSEEWIRAQLGGANLFVVTLLGELENQTVLRSFLYDHYAITAQGEDFVIFDLGQELNTGP